MIECPICNHENELLHFWFDGLLICDNCMTVLEAAAVDVQIDDDYNEYPLYEVSPICLSLLKSSCDIYLPCGPGH